VTSEVTGRASGTRASGTHPEAHAPKRVAGPSQ
jgi:hypothetical protein